MVTVVLDDKKALRDIRKQLGSLADQAPKVLKYAINSTARMARKNVAKMAKETYDVKTAAFNKSMTIKNATAINPAAIIRTKGKNMELIDFKHKLSQGDGGGIIKAKVMKKSTLTEIMKGTIKAFYVEFQSGHETIAQRVGNGRLPVKKLLSPSIPAMVGNEKDVLGVVEPQIYEMLQKQIQYQIQRTIERRR